MRSVDIHIDQIDDIRINELKIRHYFNEHGRLYVEGKINMDSVDSVINECSKDKVLTVGVADMSGGKPLFSGYVYSVEIENRAHESILKLELITKSIDFDKSRYTRTFQESECDVSLVLKHVINGIDVVAKDQKIGSMIVQYDETDWDFAVRMASKLNAPIYTEAVSGKIIVGVKTGSAKKIDMESYSVVNNLGDYRNKTNRNVNVSASDNLTYEVVTRDIVDLGEGISIEGNNMVVVGIDSFFEGEELLFKYTCALEAGIKYPYIYNDNIIGASLEGTVSSVSGVTLKVELDTDKMNPICGQREFHFATVASSNDGTGWYCMPENGDNVRLYFPTNEEKDAYIISAIHSSSTNTKPSSRSGAVSKLLGSVPAPRTDPSYKSISNKDNKEIILAPNAIYITNNQGMAIALEDDKGISIISDKDIIIQSDAVVDIESEDKLLLCGYNDVIVTQGDPQNPENYIMLSENKMTFKSEEFRLQDKTANASKQN